ncbi:P-loop containing nucleoside triphosphate hydrolase protein [Lasiosphaeria hispida]|uniref:P-loop containing nucleoside triphosphate hydrolase protein n=1 Tax=Lasiosphaeria hispida TaxID=260671 RepID=A0AAJ0HP23_9PEZI|nr:P-loop containing nucleoside triphosphate hydrolase protein [Lasiosphaeria hispida]
MQCITYLSWDKKTLKFRYVKTAKPKSKAKFSRYVVTVARRITAQGVFVGNYHVEIRSQNLSGILSEIHRDAQGVSFPPVITLDEEELKLLYHARPALSDRLKEARDKKDEDLVFELVSLLEFTNEHFDRVTSDLRELPPNHITFDHLWTLFPPNTVVYTTDKLKQVKLIRAKSSFYKKHQDGSISFYLSVDYLDSDGRHVAYVWPQMIQINSFQGSIPIQQIQAYPLRLHPECESLRKSLALRGEKILSLHGRHFQEYKGHALQERPRQFQGDEEAIIAFNSHGRVMLDPVAYDMFYPNNKLTPVMDTPVTASNLTEEQKMLLNPVLYGFSLGDKIWGAFAVSQVGGINWNDTIIDSLVLDSERKDFIHALVRTHGHKEAGNEVFDDFVRDKGKGLIGLLSGPPGVGKTLTAEAVAEIAQRPLYTISSGELGDTPSSVQANLARVFELSETWNAVVLLDEADIFLSRRTDDNLSRNAVTSVFLRHLEYYGGILLLTTNRLTSLDEAFQSRIHFTFQYRDLSTEARLKIWKKFVEKAKAIGGLMLDLSDEEIIGLASLPLNGRQIKNCMGISQAVALTNKVPLGVSCIRLAASFVQSNWRDDGEEEVM